MLTSNMSGGSCVATRLTSRLASPGVRATTRTLRPKPPMSLAFTSPRPRRPLYYAWTRKPSIQALERAQGYLKLPNGRALTGQSHDYKRHGTTTLFAALEVGTGKIIATHSNAVAVSSFYSLTAAFPGRKLHVILDNLNTHQKNEDWLKAHPNVHLPKAWLLRAS